MVIVSGDIFYVDSMEADPMPRGVDHVTLKMTLAYMNVLAVETTEKFNLTEEDL